MVMQKSGINNSLIEFLFMGNQYLVKNGLIVLSILFGMNSVSLFGILFGIHYLVVLNILF